MKFRFEGFFNHNSQKRGTNWVMRHNFTSDTSDISHLVANRCQELLLLSIITNHFISIWRKSNTNRSNNRKPVYNSLQEFMRSECLDSNSFKLVDHMAINIFIVSCALKSTKSYCFLLSKIWTSWEIPSGSPRLGHVRDWLDNVLAFWW